MQDKEPTEGQAPVPEITQAETGYDKQDPKIPLIVGLTIATVVGLVAVILGVQAYWDHVRDEQVYQEELKPIPEDLRTMRSNEDAALTTYKVLDPKTGVVRIPVSRAMELIAKEAAEGKLQYAQKEYPVKPANGPAAGATAQGTKGGNNTATPKP